MLMELGIGALALGGAWFGRDTKPVKAIRNMTGNWFSKTKVGETILLSNAEDTIKNTYKTKEENLHNDAVKLEFDEKEIHKKEEYVSYLEYAITKGKLVDVEYTSHKIDLDNAQTELKILQDSFSKKKSIIQQRAGELKNYKENVIDKQLAQAEIAKIVFKHENEIKDSEAELAKIQNLNGSTMTNTVIQKYSGLSNTGNISYDPSLYLEFKAQQDNKED